MDSGQRLGLAHSQDVSLGDVDGDGDLDALVTNWGAPSRVWLNNGQGVFTMSEVALDEGVGVETGDLNGDGGLDAFVTSWDGASTVWLNDGLGGFSDSGQNLGAGGGFEVALGDIDGDGDLDAFVASQGANTVWMNAGDGTFADSDQPLGAAITADVVLADLDGDGDLDALTGGWDETARVWLNDGMGRFTDSGRELCPGSVHIHGIAVGDIEGDGDLDVFMAIASGDPNRVWLNDGSGTFSDSGQRLSSPLAHAVGLGDLDGDGDVDAVTAHGDRWRGSEDRVWLNDGAGHFSDSGVSLGQAYSTGVQLGDLDGDGDLDVFVTHGALWGNTGKGEPNEVWFNEAR